MSARFQAMVGTPDEGGPYAPSKAETAFCKRPSSRGCCAWLLPCLARRRLCAALMLVRALPSPLPRGALLQAVEADVVRLNMAIRSLAPLVEQRVALQAELLELQQHAAGGGRGPPLASSEALQPDSPPRAPRAPSSSGTLGPLARGALAGPGSGAIYASERDAGAAKLEPQAPLPADPLAVMASLDADVIVEVARQRGALTAEVEALRGQVSEVNALRAERDALKEVEAEVIALSHEIPQLAPYVELLPALREEQARLMAAAEQAGQLQEQCETLSMQLRVAEALRGGPSANGDDAAHAAAPAGPEDASREERGHAVKASMGAVFEKLKLVESAKHELEAENGELRSTIDDLRSQLVNSHDAIEKLKGVAEALQMFRRGTL